MKLLTIGTYDTPHIGHAVFLKQCSQLADEVIVGVRSDLMVEHLRGHPPIFSFPERSRLIRELGYEVRMSDESGQAIIQSIKPDFLAVGSDWINRDLMSRYGITPTWLAEHGITLAFIPYTTGISTTELKRRLK